MATKNRRIAAYLPSEIDQKLSAFKSERGIKGDSQALLIILSEFLGVAHSVSQEVTYQASVVTLDRFEELVSQVAALSEKVETLSNSNVLNVLQEGLPSEGPTDELRSELRSEADSKLHDASPSIDTDADELSASQKASDTLAPFKDEGRTIRLSGADLAKRLGVGASTLSAKKQSSSESFGEWTRSKDPNSIAWCFASASNKYEPVGEVSPEVKNELLSDPPVGLSTGSLAKRLGIDKSTLSHKKKDATNSDFLDWTRNKDPDGTGWVFLPELNRFKPEREIQSGSKSVLQGELLNVEPLDRVNPLPEGSERSGEG